MSQNNSIPFLDLVSLHREMEEELCAVFRNVLGTAGFIGGPLVDEFEKTFAEYCDTAHCVGVGSGTDALRFALMAAGVRQGDLVVTVPHTFIATTEAISQAGGQPVFIDIDEQTYNIDVEKLVEYLEVDCRYDPATQWLFDRKTERRVTAIVPVHLYGQMADMDPILEIAEKYHLAVIEDACQAHGAQYFSKRENRWKKAGSMGRAAAFSFYPGKNLGACGEAGAITTNDAGLARQMRILRDHGQATKYYHDVEGYNGRLDALQAGILQAKMRYLPSWVELRMKAAERYRELFAGAGVEIVLPYEHPQTRSSYHLFVIRVGDRENLMKDMAAAGIGTGIHYPVPLHLQKAYKALGYRAGDFPAVEKIAKEILSLPMYPGITEEQQAKVVERVSNFVRNTEEMLVGK